MFRLGAKSGRRRVRSDLNIAPIELFDALQAQLKARSTGQRSGIVAQRRPQLLLSGLIRCRACGSGMAVSGLDRSGRKRIRCSAHTNSGACPDPKTFYLDDVEALVMDIRLRQRKTKVTVLVPVGAPLRAALEAAKRKLVSGPITNPAP